MVRIEQNSRMSRLEHRYPCRSDVRLNYKKWGKRIGRNRGEKKKKTKRTDYFSESRFDHVP